MRMVPKKAAALMGFCNYKQSDKTALLGSFIDAYTQVHCAAVSRLNKATINCDGARDSLE